MLFRGLIQKPEDLTTEAMNVVERAKEQHHRIYFDAIVEAKIWLTRAQLRQKSPFVIALHERLLEVAVAEYEKHSYLWK